MNKIGKMGRKNSKIPGSRMKSQKRPQKKLKQYSELSAEDKKKLKNTALQHYEEYVDSKGDRDKIEQIISQILTECGFVDNLGNRRCITSSIASEKQKRKNEKEKTLVPTEKPKHRNKLSLLVSEEINNFIIKKNLHAEYLEAENNRGKKADIINTILNECKIEDYPKNRIMIRRLILQQIFKPWSDEEEKTLEELLREKINTAVWNESGDDNKIMQARKQILDDFNEMAPGNEHNEQDIMHKMRLLACYVKNTTPKPISVKSRESKPIRSRRIKPVQQAVFKIVREGVQLDNADKKLDKQFNNQPAEEQDTTCDVAKTPIYITKDANDTNDDTLPFFLDTSILDGCEEYCENYSVL